MSTSTFLPDDYIEQKAARRTNIINLTLFAVVLVGVFAAFLVTNRQWSQVKKEQEAINIRYQQEADKVRDLKELEVQRQDMLDKAELAASLIDRVPRSILLAELVNRMPSNLSLLQFEMTSMELKPQRTAVKRGSTGKLGGPDRPKTRDEVAREVKKITPPRHRVDISIIGLAPTDVEVSRYMHNLNQFILVEDVRLAFSEEREIDDRILRQFKIHMSLDPDVDARALVDPEASAPESDPMGSTTSYGSTATATTLEEDH